MMLFGSHMSIAGGYYRAVDEASETGCNVVQLFTKNNNQWRAKPITDEDVELFQAKLQSLKIQRPLAHASYLLNLASPQDEMWQKSVEGLVVEWQRAARLGLDGVVVHPGSHLASSESDGLSRIVEGIKRAHDIVQPTSCWLLLENTAGQGSNLGWKLDHLGYMLDATGEKMHVGVCIDSCHTHASGYDLAGPDGLKRFIKDAKATGVLPAVRAIHLNDSKREAGSRVDRHEHIGRGTIGEEGISRFIQHSAFKKLPMYLETEKGDAPDGRPWDVVNLETVRRLATARWT
jgi:deoxyribonuclease-4